MSVVAVRGREDLSVVAVRGREDARLSWRSVRVVSAHRTMIGAVCPVGHAIAGRCGW